MSDISEIATALATLGGDAKTAFVIWVCVTQGVNLLGGMLACTTIIVALRYVIRHAGLGPAAQFRAWRNRFSIGDAGPMSDSEMDRTIKHINNLIEADERRTRP